MENNPTKTALRCRKFPAKSEASNAIVSEFGARKFPSEFRGRKFPAKSVAQKYLFRFLVSITYNKY
jgi:hypothetical protein